MLEALNLECVRGERRLFAGVGFRLEGGEMLYLQGKNGSGKTSMLRMLCGLTQPASGEIRWRDRPIGKLGDSLLDPLGRRLDVGVEEEQQVRGYGSRARIAAYCRQAAADDSCARFQSNLASRIGGSSIGDDDRVRLPCLPCDKVEQHGQPGSLVEYRYYDCQGWIVG